MANDTSRPPAAETEREFDALAKRGKQGVVRELWALIRDNKKWWLTPIIVVLLLLAVLIALGGTGAAPFIYTIF